MGAMASMGHVGYVPLLLASTLGSTLGFAAMYWLGSKFDKKVIHSGKFKFLSSEGLLKAEDWFRKYGLWLIVANRFLTGTRAVISFFAGISRLQFSVTVALSAISALVWNSLLIYLGSVFGDNWKTVDYYMSLYGKIILPIAVVIILFLAWRWYRSNFGPQKPPNSGSGENK